MRSWEPEQLRAFLTHVGGDRLFAAFLLAATTGMRRGEVLGLRWQDVDLDARRLSVRQALVSIDYRLAFSELKTDRGKRMLDLDATTVSALRAWRKVQTEERLA